ncbi:MAG: hypothetical protein QXD13_01150 [Candidatus Pacearchaeota archaeon]
MKGLSIMFIVMLLSFGVALLWDNLPEIKSAVHSVLDPTAGVLLDWHTNLGMIIIVAIFTMITTLLQKYMTDQDTLKTIKEEQKIIQQEIKLAKESPEKKMELSKKSMELSMKAMPIAMRPAMYTIIPFVLFFRWFNDYFKIAQATVFGISWFWSYLIFSIIFSSIFRKMLKVH